MMFRFVSLLLILPLVSAAGRAKYSRGEPLESNEKSTKTDLRATQQASYNALKGEDFDVYFHQLIKRDLQMSMPDKETKMPKDTKAPTGSDKVTKAPADKATKAPAEKMTKAPTDKMTKAPKIEGTVPPSVAPMIAPSVAPAPPSMELFPVVLINSGSLTDTYTSTIGDVWEVDNFFNTGIVRERITEYEGTDEDALFYQDRSQQGMRPLVYDIPVDNGMYVVELYFAEARGGRYEIGARVFDVTIEGELALENFDIFGTAGERWTAVVETIVTTVEDGALTIELVGTVDQGKINAIGVYEAAFGLMPETALPSDLPSSLPSLVPVDSSTPAPSVEDPPTSSMLTPIVQINCGNEEGPYEARDGTTWVMDESFNGGVARRRARAFAGTRDSILYHTDRTGTSDFPILIYDIPIENGMYIVQLLFSETRNDFFASGARVFDVSIEGNVVLEDYDIYDTAGAEFVAGIETIMATVTDSSLTIAFEGSVDFGKISAIGVYGIA